MNDIFKEQSVSLGVKVSTQETLRASVDSQETLQAEMTSQADLQAVVTAQNSLSGTIAKEGSLEGKIAADMTSPLGGKSAYEIAVDNGFIGTVTEWLESLKGKDGNTPKIGEITLSASAWVGEGNLYHQIVNVEGATENSQVDLKPDVNQLAIFYEKDLSFVTENDNGIVTVYVIGQKPTNDYTIQVTITEVDI